MQYVDNTRMNCPICEETVKSQYIKQWNFQEFTVRRYECENCGNRFNVYEGMNGKKYTIPKGPI